MPALCGVCAQQQSRYKCPACQLPYCSLVCYKTHKPIHSIETPEAADASLTSRIVSNTTNSPATTRSQLPTQARPNLQNILTSPAISSILSTNPTLVAQLRKIYTATLPPSDPKSTYKSIIKTTNHNRYQPYSSRGRGSRGRGRGGQFGRDHDRMVPWTQERAEEEAMKMFARLRGVEDEGGRLVEEFVRKVKDVVGGLEDTTATAAIEEHVAMVTM